MSKFLEEAKKEFWRSGRRVTPEFRARVSALLLEKLRVLGETDQADQEWADELVRRTFPGD